MSKRDIRTILINATQKYICFIDCYCLHCQISMMEERRWTETYETYFIVFFKSVIGWYLSIEMLVDIFYWCNIFIYITVLLSVIGVHYLFWRLGGRRFTYSYLIYHAAFGLSLQYIYWLYLFMLIKCVGFIAFNLLSDLI